MKVQTRRIPLVLLGAAAFFSVIFRLFYVPILVRGDSMEPNFHSGSLLLFARCRYWTPPRRFEIVIASAGGELLLKRVIAFPGEWVSMTNGVIFVNGRTLPEPFPVLRGTWTVKPGPIPLGKVLLMGDNRGVPVQSFFVVPTDAIIACKH